LASTDKIKPEQQSQNTK